jgi:hypothetical protein
VTNAAAEVRTGLVSSYVATGAGFAIRSRGLITVVKALVCGVAMSVRYRRARCRARVFRVVAESGRIARRPSHVETGSSAELKARHESQSDPHRDRSHRLPTARHAAIRSPRRPVQCSRATTVAAGCVAERRVAIRRVNR